jgi:hypothetical protein
MSRFVFLIIIGLYVLKFVRCEHIVVWLCAPGFSDEGLGFYKHFLLPPNLFLHMSIQQYKNYLISQNITDDSFRINSAFPIIESRPVFDPDAVDLHHLPRILVYNIENSGWDAKYTIVMEWIHVFNRSVDILMHLSDEFMANPRKYKVNSNYPKLGYL